MMQCGYAKTLYIYIYFIMFIFERKRGRRLEKTSRRLLCSLSQLRILSRPQFQLKMNFWTLLCFQWLTDIHNITLQNITEHYTKHHVIPRMTTMRQLYYLVTTYWHLVTLVVLCYYEPPHVVVTTLVVVITTVRQWRTTYRGTRYDTH